MNGRWQFQLPKLTYPISVDTIGKVMALGSEISMCCHTCNRFVRLNLVTIAKHKGMDYPCLADDLKKVVYCNSCRQAGRDAKNIGFISHALIEPHSRWSREEPENDPCVPDKVNMA